MNIPIEATFHSDDLTFNGRLYTSQPLNHPLIRAAREAPQNIDSLLRPHLYSDTLPSDLERLMRDYVSTLTTPGPYGGGIRSRPRWFYANCALFGMLLGRAFALLSTPTRPPRSLDTPREFPFMNLPAELRLQIYGYYKEDLAQRREYWEVMTRVFVKALFSGREPEEGARYTTGIIMLTCGHTMSQAAPLLRGHGSRYVWWDDSIKDLDHTWGWRDIQSAIFATKELPRHNNDALALQRRWEAIDQSQPDDNLPEIWRDCSEYVSRETLEVLDLAREHLRADERDWTPPEIEARLIKPLFDNEEARTIWEGTGLVPRVYETKFALERSLDSREWAAFAHVIGPQNN